MNKVCLTGRITKDVEMRYSQSGMAFTSFTLAVDRNGQKDANGNKLTDFISCKAFSHTADFLGKFVHKGYMLAVEGSIQTGSYLNSNQEKVYTTDVMVERVENLTPQNNQPQPNPATYGTPKQQSNPYQGYNNPGYDAQPSASHPQAETPFTPDDNDLPF